MSKRTTTLITFGSDVEFVDVSPSVAKQGYAGIIRSASLTVDGVAVTVESGTPFRRLTVAQVTALDAITDDAKHPTTVAIVNGKPGSVTLPLAAQGRPQKSGTSMAARLAARSAAATATKTPRKARTRKAPSATQTAPDGPPAS